MFCASSCTIRTRLGLRIQLTCKEVHCRVSTANNVQKHPRGEQLREIVYVHRTEYYTAKKSQLRSTLNVPGMEKQNQHLHMPHNPQESISLR